ncbi:MAG TPA: hypothetical protein PKC51_01175 [Ferruginibacter sp.]|nr:hypothetical protein [Ferruginibacter sp.]
MPLVAFVRCYDRQEYSRLPFHSRQHAKAGAKSACEKERTAARLNMSVFDASLSVHGLKGMIALHHKITIKKKQNEKNGIRNPGVLSDGRIPGVHDPGAEL